MKNKEDNLLFLYNFGNCVNPVTGGQVYDGRLYETLKSLLGNSILYVSNKDFPVSNIYITAIYLLFNFWKYQAKVIIVNASKPLAYLPYFLILRYILRRKTYCIVHHLSFFEIKGKIKRVIYKYIEILFLKISYGVICPNPYVRDQLKNFNIKRIFSINHYFDNVNQKIDLIKNKSKIKLLFVGTIEKRKGLEYLLKALNHIDTKMKNKITVDIVGNIKYDQYFDELNFLVKNYNLSGIVKFKGRLKSSELSNEYKNADIFIFPSLLEGLGLVLLEAMSYSLPVIAFNNSAIPLTVKDKYNGLLCKNQDWIDMSGKIEILLNNIELRKYLSKNARKTFESTWKKKDFINSVENFLKYNKLK